MKLKHIILNLTLMLLFTISAQGGVITIFDSNSTISDGYSYDTAVIKGDGTVVTMDGGTIDTLITMDASTFNMTGGSIYDSSSYDSSNINFEGGSVGGTFSMYGESKAVISGNFSCSCGDFPMLFHNSELSISSTDFSVGGFSVKDRSTLNISAGNINNVALYGEDSSANISGGTIGRLAVSRYADVATINIIGYDLEAVPYGGVHGKGQVSGHWNDDSAFLINFGGDEPGEDPGGEEVYEVIELYDGVLPTDCIKQPTSDLNDDCKVNFIDFSKMAVEWLQDGTI